MKKRFVVAPLVLLLMIPGALLAQIPNSSFESWTGTTPPILDGWFTNNIPGFAETITRSTSAHLGSFAVQGAVVPLAFVNTLDPPFLQSYFPYTGRPGMLTGFYAFTSVSRDTLEVIVALYKSSLSQLVATGGWGTATSTTGYAQFTAPLEYFSAEAPDTAWIWIATGTGDNDTVHLGTTLLLDDFAFEGTATSISATPGKPAAFALHQNYPNPFNPATTIRFELAEAAHVRLSVYNLLGEEIALLVDEQRQAGIYDQRFDASGLASGTYFYRVEAQKAGGGNFVQVRKMTIIR